MTKPLERAVLLFSMEKGRVETEKGGIVRLWILRRIKNESGKTEALEV